MASAQHHKSRMAHKAAYNNDQAGWVEGISRLTHSSAAVGLLVDDKTADRVQKENVLNDNNRQSASDTGNNNDFDHVVTALLEEVLLWGELLREVGSSEGIGGWCVKEEAELQKLLEKLQQHVEHDGHADITVLRKRKVADLHVADVLLRIRAAACASIRPAVEVRVAVIGNVDSGKSTMVGVLTRSLLDDGRGLARSKVFRHGHEESTGRTSSIGQHTLCLDSRGSILNDANFRVTHCGEYVSRASKVLTLVDLAGHERYFKTTAYGLTGYLPDHACLIIGANAGLVGMCKEHLGVALALKIPVFFVVTKIDIAPDHVLQNTVQTLTNILKKPGVRKKPLLVRSASDVVTAAKHMQNESIAPIILTSSVTGEGLDLVRLMFNLLPQRHNWPAQYKEHAEFIIDETFGVPGVGTVVAGTVKKGTILPNSVLLLGPDIGDGTFKPAAVKSIHYKRLPVTSVVAGQTAALALKRVKRSAVRKGMVLVDERSKPEASWEFLADIAILTHTTTIQPKYQAVIHCEIVRQAAQVISMDQEFLRSGDRSRVRFRFLQRPEYLTPGSRFVFREGRTKGIGVIVSAV